MKLVIAEKPSVAQSLAAVIGATARKDGYLEGGGWRVSWCVGHLAGLADADAYNPDYAKWRYDDLPRPVSSSPALPSRGFRTDDGLLLPRRPAPSCRPFHSPGRRGSPMAAARLLLLPAAPISPVQGIKRSS